MYLQRVEKYTLSQFDYKRCYGSNIRSKPWDEDYNCMIMYKNSNFQVQLVRNKKQNHSLVH